MKMKFVLYAVCCLLFAPSLAQHWEFEQVDSGAMGGPTTARTSDGRVWLSYLSQDSVVWVAFKDTTWHREPVGEAQGTARPSIAVGPRGTVGVVYDSSGICYALRTDTGWVRERLPYAGTGPRLSYDSADVPLVISGTTNGANLKVFATTRVDTTWVTAMFLLGGPSFYTNGSWTAGRFRHDNLAHVFVYVYWEFNSSIWESYFSLFEGYGDRWYSVWDSSVAQHGAYEVGGLRLASTGLDTYCFTGFNTLFFMGQSVDSPAVAAAFHLDSLDRPHIAYAAGRWGSGRLKYAYRARGTWFIADVPDTGVVLGCDLLLDSLVEPVIAYVRADGGLWFVHGVDVVGQTEERSGPPDVNLGHQATIARGVLLLPRAQVAGPRPRSELLDALGRKMLDLDIGANDVTVLPAGVYFVREQSVVSSQQSGRTAMRKVVVAR